MDTVNQELTPKERILKTVDRLFYEQGYMGTGTNQIITEAKVAKASFYHHFPSKETLVLEYLEAYQTKFLNHLKQVEKQFSEPKAKILALFDVLAEYARQTEYRGCPFLNLTGEFSQAESKPRLLIARFKTELKTYVERLVFETASSENVDRKAASALGTTVYLLYEAALIESRVHRDLWPIEASKTAVDRLLS